MNDRLVPFLWRRRTSVFIIGPIVMLIFSRPSFPMWLMALPIVAIGEMVRFWAAGHLEKNGLVVTSGPFGYVRNPLYCGSALIFVGMCMMCNRLDLTLVLMPLFGLFHWGATVFEEKHLCKVFGSDFEDYTNQVPRFFPRFRSVGNRGAFSLALALTNREHKSALGTVVMIVLFGFRGVLPVFSFADGAAGMLHSVLKAIGLS